jgi:hypothetical protein
MTKKRIFISFDYDHDVDIKTMLAGQAKLPDSPFDFTDASLKEALTGDWKDKVKRRLRNCDQMIVLCGSSTHAATGVSVELNLAKEVGLPYFLIRGRADEDCRWPSAVSATDKMYDWTWSNIKALIGGAR